MTLDEEHELEILRIFVTHKIEKFGFRDLPQEFKDKVGLGDWIEISNMVRNGYVVENGGIDYEFTKAGTTRYFALKKKKDKEWIPKLIVWGTLIAAIISAIASISTCRKDYAKVSVSSDSLHNTQKESIPPLKPKIPTHDSTYNHDSLAKKINDTSKVKVKIEK